MKELWTEKYRPSTIDGYVFRDSAQREQIESWIKDRAIPHLIFSGNAGIGKTTLAKILVNQLEVNEFDLLEINASRTNSVDDVRDKIQTFVETMPFGEFKVVLLDEADYLSPNAQAALRGVMETYAHTARFILTCNYPTKIIPALHSRCQGFHIERVDVTEFTTRAATVLVEEDIEFDLDTLDTYVKGTYPDLRKCLNTLQMNSTSGKLAVPSNSEGSTSDWKLSAVELFKEGRIMEARKLMCSSVRPEEMEDVYRWMYDNLSLWGKDQEQQDRAIIIIKQGLVNVSFVADQEINLSATLAELCQIS
jgi:replication factor C small subunit